MLSRKECRCYGLDYRSKMCMGRSVGNAVAFRVKPTRAEKKRKDYADSAEYVVDVMQHTMRLGLGIPKLMSPKNRLPRLSLMGRPVVDSGSHPPTTVSTSKSKKRDRKNNTPSERIPRPQHMGTLVPNLTSSPCTALPLPRKMDSAVYQNRARTCGQAELSDGLELSSGGDKNVSRRGDVAPARGGGGLDSTRTISSVEDAQFESSSVGSGVSRGSLESLDSLKSMDSLGKLDTSWTGGDNVLKPEEQMTGEGPHSSKGLGLVDRVLFQSWRVLPWQARLCPMAMEERENRRLVSAVSRELRRAEAWREEQQVLATQAAQEEEAELAEWWSHEGNRLWEWEKGRKDSYMEMLGFHKALLAKYEDHRTSVLSAGYGVDLGDLDKMEKIEHQCRLKEAESILSSSLHECLLHSGTPPANPDQDTDQSDKPGASHDKPTERTPSVPPKHELDQVALARTLQVKAQDEVTRSAGQTSLASNTIKARFRRRESLTHLVYLGLSASFRDLRRAAHRRFVSESAAHVGRTLSLASLAQESCLKHGWDREKARVDTAIAEEARSVEAWACLQHRVLKRNTQIVLRLLRSPSPVSPMDTEVGSMLSSPIWPERDHSESADARLGVRHRSRRTLECLRKRTGTFERRALMVKEGWLKALEQWQVHLGRRQIGVAREQAARLREVQKENMEKSSISEKHTLQALEERRDAAVLCWESMLNLECRRIQDAFEAWSACLTGAVDKLIEITEEVEQERIRSQQLWEEEMCRYQAHNQDMQDLVEGEVSAQGTSREALAQALSMAVSESCANEAIAGTISEKKWWEEAIKGVRGSLPQLAEHHLPTSLPSLDASKGSSILTTLQGLSQRAGERASGALADLSQGLTSDLVKDRGVRAGTSLERCSTTLAKAEEQDTTRRDTFRQRQIQTGLDFFQGTARALERFRAGLEAEIVARLSRSFDKEVRRLVGTAGQGGGWPGAKDRGEASEEGGGSSVGLTRAQLDLRRTGRARSFVGSVCDWLVAGLEAWEGEAREVATQASLETNHAACFGQEERAHRLREMIHSVQIHGEEARSFALLEAEACLSTHAHVTSTRGTANCRGLGMALEWFQVLVDSWKRFRVRHEEQWANANLGLEESHRTLKQKSTSEHSDRLQFLAKCVEEWEGVQRSLSEQITDTIDTWKALVATELEEAFVARESQRERRKSLIVVKEDDDTRFMEGSDGEGGDGDGGLGGGASDSNGGLNEMGGTRKPSNGNEGSSEAREMPVREHAEEGDCPVIPRRRSIVEVMTARLRRPSTGDHKHPPPAPSPPPLSSPSLDAIEAGVRQELTAATEIMASRLDSWRDQSGHMVGVWRTSRVDDSRKIAAEIKSAAESFWREKEDLLSQVREEVAKSCQLQEGGGLVELIRSAQVNLLTTGDSAERFSFLVAQASEREAIAADGYASIWVLMEGALVSVRQQHLDTVSQEAARLLAKVQKLAEQASADILPRDDELREALDVSQKDISERLESTVRAGREDIEGTLRLLAGMVENRPSGEGRTGVEGDEVEGAIKDTHNITAGSTGETSAEDRGAEENHMGARTVEDGQASTSSAVPVVDREGLVEYELAEDWREEVGKGEAKEAPGGSQYGFVENSQCGDIKDTGVEGTGRNAEGIEDRGSPNVGAELPGEQKMNFPGPFSDCCPPRDNECAEQPGAPKSDNLGGGGDASKEPRPWQKIQDVSSHSAEDRVASSTCPISGSEYGSFQEHYTTHVCQT